MFKSILEKYNTKILYKAFSVVFMVTVATLLFSCKHKKDETVYITLTLEADKHITLKDNEGIAIESGSKWKDIKKIAIEKIISSDDGWQFDAFKIKNKELVEDIIKDEWVFNQDTVIVAIAKKEMIKIEVVADEGYVFPSEKSFEFPKYSFWKDMREKAKSIALLKEDYDEINWKNESGSVITDETMFDGNAKIFAYSKIKPEKNPKNVVIIIKGNEFVEVTEGKLIEEKNISWLSIKEKVIKKIKIKDNCYIFEWRENSENGEEIKEDKIFDRHTTIFAIGKEKKVNIRIDCDEGYEKNVSLINIEVLSGSLWKDIRKRAEEGVKLKDDYFKDVWRLNGKDGKEIVLDYHFTEESYTVFATSKKKNISITVTKDEGYKTVDNTPIKVANPATWASIVEKAKEKLELLDGYEPSIWKLKNQNGAEIKNDYVFSDDETVLATSKPKDIQYKIEHKAESLDNPNYYETFWTEKKIGKAYGYTQAQSIFKKGFEAEKIIQQKILPNEIVVVEVKYKRKEIKLFLNLNGGSVTTPLIYSNGKYILKGKFERNVEIAEPKRKGFIFSKWTPTLPHTFNTEDEGREYSASWLPVFEIKVVGDERFTIYEPIYTVPRNGTTYGSIKENLKARLKLKPEWDRSNEKGFYGFYAFRLNDERGRILSDSDVINQDMTLYAQSNFMKFVVDIYGRLCCENKNGRFVKPRGKIIIPSETKEIIRIAFYDCRQLELVDASLCNNLKTLKNRCFDGCTKAIIKLPVSLKTIEDYAFGKYAYCKKVIVPNDQVRTLVRSSKYPVQLIENGY